MEKSVISYADFAKLDMRIGTILEASEINGSEKLLKFLIDLGDLGQRTILSGIKMYFNPEELVGTQVLVLVNLAPRKMMGFESQGMILMGVEYAASSAEDLNEPKEEKVTLLVPQNQVPAGTGVE
jgi:methionyl-tRNA synthetase